MAETLDIGLVIGLVFGLILGALVMWLFLRKGNADYDAVKIQLKSEFLDIAQQSLQNNNEQFLQLAEQNLGVHQERAKRELSEREKAVETLVKPIKDALQNSQKQIAELEKARGEAYGGIRAQLESMQTDQKNLAQETQNLVNALRRPEVRGRWGEMTLKRCVELAGMVEHCDFQEQVHKQGDEKAIRPDMIIRMPNERELVVDVKTPLDAYLEAIEAEDEKQRKVALKRYARNVREHIRSLSSKAYWDQFSQSPDFVILFIPGDQFLSAATNEDPELIEKALSQHIILATPTSFVALLKAVAYGWRQLALTDNAAEIRKLAEDLYSRLETFVSHLGGVGKQLSNSVEKYNAAIGSLERRVLPGARKFVDLGIHPTKKVGKLEQIEQRPRQVIGSDNDADRESDASSE